MLPLKDYQQRTLATLTAYFRACLQFGSPSQAFYFITEQNFGQGIPYNPVKELPGLPYVCLRLPTGGGKTLVAAHSISIAASELLHADYPLVLWLVPSNTIREQTIKALKDHNHPYRQAVEAKSGPVHALGLSEALFVQPATLNTGTTIIVSTMQAFRVEDTEGRKVYEASGSLMSHFSGLSADTLNGVDKYANNEPVPSLANVIRLRRPLVIVDEAHNARTGLSFETLQRFNPSCILEFTATPDTVKSPSNVLHTVSAAELKTEGMIKLPIQLETHLDWKETVASAVSTRNQLEEMAREEREQTGEYIRPILLLQAQPNYKNRVSITVEVVEKCLLNDHLIPKAQIARATGDDYEIEGVDLSKPECPIRFIITVQALREGWDCPFAYILCTVAEMRSQTAVEQILGRVLRLPKAQEKIHPELNMAYAFAASPHFTEAANALADALVQNGFQKQEVRELIFQSQPRQEELSFGPLFEWADKSGQIVIPVTENPALDNLPPETAAKVNYDSSSRKLVIREELTPDEIFAIRNLFQNEQEGLNVEKTIRQVQINRTLVKGTSGRVNLSIPVLAVKQGELFEQFEESHIRECFWNLSKRDPYLSEEEFPASFSEGEKGVIDIDSSGRVQRNFIQVLQNQMSWLSDDQGWSVIELASWLDRNIEHIEIPHNQSIVFFTGMVESLISKRNFTLESLVREKYRLRKAATAKFLSYRQSAWNETFQQFLSPDFATPLVVTPDVCFSFDPNLMNYPYPQDSLHPGQHSFKKHYYPTVGDLKAKGEEFECAQFIDTRPEIKIWLRNLEGRERHSFWLQTSTDRFYPDFVCLLYDGRYLVVEYKGEDRWSNDDSKEKRAIGKVWEERSDGKCLFVMPKGKDLAAIQAKLVS
jgi:type III restriction enzyme